VLGITFCIEKLFVFLYCRAKTMVKKQEEQPMLAQQIEEDFQRIQTILAGTDPPVRALCSRNNMLFVQYDLL
jgi:hypothetical protein